MHRIAFEMRTASDAQVRSARMGRRHVRRAGTSIHTWARESGRGNRVGSGDGRSKELVDTRRDELRTRERWDCDGRRNISERRQIESRRRIYAMTLARTYMAAIMIARGRVFVATLARRSTVRHSAVRRIVHRAIGLGGGRNSSRGGRPSRTRHRRVRPIKRRLCRLQRQPDHELKHQQHKQCSFGAQNFCQMASHAEELTPKVLKDDTRDLTQA
jgi:hypothetical protein